jgi:GTP diphosphokinase / guanosine-3',5'-bis(diphosphate) 3'-diphosphatase
MIQPTDPNQAADELVRRVQAYLPPAGVTAVQQALAFAADAHAGFFRKNGDPYLAHPIATAAILAGWRAPAAVLAAALLHDTGKSRYARAAANDAIARRFGPEIGALVGEVANLGYGYPNSAGKKERGVTYQLRAVALALQRAPLAVVIKLADRLHNLETLDALAPEDRERYAVSTNRIFIPFAERLGMRAAKRRLENVVFQYLEPEAFARLQVEYAEAARAAAASGILAAMRAHLERCGLAADAALQPLSWYALHARLRERAEPPALHLAQPLRVCVQTTAECYRALGHVHALWPPQAEQIRDLIARPQPNGYRALHTRVDYRSGQMLDVILSSHDMHRAAEYGVTARWLGAPEAFLPQVARHPDAAPGQMVVITQDGDELTLPEGATPVDFAYALHHELGNSCTGAWVNGRSASLTQPLQNWDVVQIRKGRAQVGPSPEWLDSVKTKKARNAIRRWLMRQSPNAAANKGMDILEDCLRREGMLLTSIQVLQRLAIVAEQMSYERRRDLLIAIGLNRLDPQTVVRQLKKPPRKGDLPASLQATIVSLIDADQPQRLANCCKPAPPDPIVAYVNRHRVAMIHRADCPQIAHLQPQLDAEWALPDVHPHAQIELTALDRAGLVRDVSQAIADLDILMLGFHADRLLDGSARIEIGLEAMPQAQIDALLGALRQVADVRQAALRDLTRHPRVMKGAVLERRFVNPYTLQPVTGQAFFGRQNDLQELVSYLRDVGPGRALLLWGPRRIGKTSLLREFQHLMNGEDYVVAFIDMQRVSGRSTGTFLLEIIRAIVAALNDPTVKTPNWARMKRDPLDYFRSFLDNVPVLQEKDLVLIFDEFQLLSKLREEQTALADINHFFRSLIQHRNSLSVIFSGGGVMETLLHHPQTSAMLEVVRQKQVSCLEETAARDLIVKPVPHIRYSPSTVEGLLTLTNRHPYYLQLVCGELAARAERDLRLEITDQHVEELLADWLPYQGEQYFSNLWGSTIGFDLPAERRHRLVVQAIAEQGNVEGWVSSEQLARSPLMTALDADQLWRTLHDLVKIDSLDVRYGEQFGVKVRLFEMWLRKTNTLEQLLRGKDSGT